MLNRLVTLIRENSGKVGASLALFFIVTLHIFNTDADEAAACGFNSTNVVADGEKAVAMLEYMTIVWYLILVEAALFLLAAWMGGLKKSDVSFSFNNGANSVVGALIALVTLGGALTTFIYPLYYFSHTLITFKLYDAASCSSTFHWVQILALSISWMSVVVHGIVVPVWIIGFFRSSAADSVENANLMA